MISTSVVNNKTENIKKKEKKSSQEKRKEEKKTEKVKKKLGSIICKTHKQWAEICDMKVHFTFAWTRS